MGKHHVVKLWPKYYEPVRDRRKLFEVRVNDRNYQEGDTITMQEWCPDRKDFTGRPDLGPYKIGYLFSDLGTRSNVVVFSLLEVPPNG